MSTLLLTRRLAGGAAANGGESGGPLALTLGGSSQTIDAAEPLGKHTDGTPRTLYLDFACNATNGSPLTGTLTVPGRSIAVAYHRNASGTGSTRNGLAVFLQPGDIPVDRIAEFTFGTPTDLSATWTNTNTSTWEQGGLPDGGLAATSATHLCETDPENPLTPQSGQPAFTGSAAVDTAFEESYVALVQGWDGNSFYGGAQYERAMALIDYYKRTGNYAYLKTALSFLARMRSFYWAANGGLLPEPNQVWESHAHLYLLRRDTDARDWIRTAATTGYQNSAFWNNQDVDTNPRFNAAIIRKLLAAHVIGDADRVANVGTATFSEILINTIAPLAVATGSTKPWYNDQCRMYGYQSDGTTLVGNVYTYMMLIMCDAMKRMCSWLPNGSDKTAALAQVENGLIWLYNNARTTNSTSGTIAFVYSTNDLYYGNRAITTSGAYTSGTTITITGLTPNVTYGTGPLIIGGVSRRITTSVSTNGSGTATVTLASGFPSSISSGTSGAFNEQLAAAGGAEVDLNGFGPHLFAWLAKRLASSIYAAFAKALYATIGYTPRDGNYGPYLTNAASSKQWDEAFHRSQETLRELADSGL